MAVTGSCFAALKSFGGNLPIVDLDFSKLLLYILQPNSSSAVWFTMVHAISTYLFNLTSMIKCITGLTAPPVQKHPPLKEIETSFTQMNVEPFLEWFLKLSSLENMALSHFIHWTDCFDFSLAARFNSCCFICVSLKRTPVAFSTFVSQDRFSRRVRNICQSDINADITTCTRSA